MLNKIYFSVGHGNSSYSLPAVLKLCTDGSSAPAELPKGTEGGEVGKPLEAYFSASPRTALLSCSIY